MSGLIIFAFTGLLMQEPMPHASTRETYRAPAIRPFEPGPGFAVEPAQGDDDAEVHRRALEAPVSVEAYVRSYEFTPGDVETAYDQGVTSAEMRVDQTAGPLDGAWRVVDAEGRTRYDLVLIDPGVGPAEGGWRKGTAWGAATSDGATLTLEGAGHLTLERAGNGWRGVLTAEGQSRPVRLVRPD